MPSSIDHIAEQIFKIIKGFGHDLVLFTDGGKKTVDPMEARRFYIRDLQIMVNFNIDQSSNKLVVNLSKGTDISDIKTMLDSLRAMVSKYLVSYEVKTFGKKITPKDFAYMAKNKTNESRIRRKNNTRIDEGFSGWHGTSRKSINELNGSKLIVRHKNTVKEDHAIPLSHVKKYPEKEVFFRVLHNGADAAGRVDSYEKAKALKKSYKKRMREEGYSTEGIDIVPYVKHVKHGARTRQIESVFVENSSGERFKFPTNNITAAKAMLRHVSEGGTPYDDFGEYIYETMNELENLKHFQKQDRRNKFFEDENVVEEINSRVNSLRENLKKITTIKGYKESAENYSREANDVSKEKLNELKDAVTLRYFDDSISESLPYVAKIIENLRLRENNQNSIQEFARYVMNNKSNLYLNRDIDESDPDNPVNRNFTDPATAVAAWVEYLAPMIKDDELANMLMRVSDVVHDMDSKHVNLASVAINVLRSNAKVSNSKSRKESIYDEQVEKINESFDKYEIRKVFGL